jgi:hypothetical protein
MVVLMQLTRVKRVQPMMMDLIPPMLHKIMMQTDVKMLMKIQMMMLTVVRIKAIHATPIVV